MTSPGASVVILVVENGELEPFVRTDALELPEMDLVFCVADYVGADERDCVAGARIVHQEANVATVVPQLSVEPSSCVLKHRDVCSAHAASPQETLRVVECLA